VASLFVRTYAFCVGSRPSGDGVLDHGFRVCVCVFAGLASRLTGDAGGLADEHQAQAFLGHGTKRYLTASRLSFVAQLFARKGRGQACLQNQRFYIPHRVAPRLPMSCPPYAYRRPKMPRLRKYAL